MQEAKKWEAELKANRMKELAEKSAPDASASPRSLSPHTPLPTEADGLAGAWQTTVEFARALSGSPDAPVDEGPARASSPAESAESEEQFEEPLEEAVGGRRGTATSSLAGADLADITDIVPQKSRRSSKVGGTLQIKVISAYMQPKSKSKYSFRFSVTKNDQTYSIWRPYSQVRALRKVMMGALGPKTYLPPLKKSNIAYGLRRNKEIYTRMKSLQSFLSYVGSYRASGAAASLINLQLDYFLDPTADDLRMANTPDDPALVTMFSDNVRAPVLGDTSALDEAIGECAKTPGVTGRQQAFVDDILSDEAMALNTSLDWDDVLDAPAMVEENANAPLDTNLTILTGPIEELLESEKA